jgi:queuine tRNA-ribosyltransferase
VFGIVQGGVYEDLRHESAEYVSAAGVDGVAIGGTLGRDKDEMRGVVAMAVERLPEEAPRHLLGIGEPDDLVHGIGMGIEVFDCAVPTRLARHGMALAPRPDDRHRFDIRKGEFALDSSPLVEGCPCPTCAAHTRAYVHYLSRSEELTGVRLLVMHNLTYLERLVAGCREAIGDGRFAAYRDSILAGEPPWAAG